MKKRGIITSIMFILLLLIPVLCYAEVNAFSIMNNIGIAPQDVLVTIDTTSDIRAIKIMDSAGRAVAASISQSQSRSRKSWSLLTTITTSCSDEWTVYLKGESGSWHTSDISFFVDIESSGHAQTSQPRLTPTPAPSWSSGPFSYTWADTKERSDNRVNTHSGPSNSFMDSGSYRTRKITGLSAMFEEKYSGITWVYAEMYYQNGYKRRLYFKNNQILYGSVPYVSFSRTPAILSQDVIPTYGPAPDYDDFEDERYQIVTLQSNLNVSILHEENNYFFIEFTYAGKECRAWVPTYTVQVR